MRELLSNRNRVYLVVVLKPGRTVHISPPANSVALGDLLPLWLKGEYITALRKREGVISGEASQRWASAARERQRSAVACTRRIIAKE
jgi:hypothetical protein